MAQLLLVAQVPWPRLALPEPGYTGRIRRRPRPWGRGLRRPEAHFGHEGQRAVCVQLLGIALGRRISGYRRCSGRVPERGRVVRIRRPCTSPPKSPLTDSPGDGAAKWERSPDVREQSRAFSRAIPSRLGVRIVSRALASSTSAKTIPPDLSSPRRGERDGVRGAGIFLARGGHEGPCPLGGSRSFPARKSMGCARTIREVFVNSRHCLRAVFAKNAD